MKLPQTFTRITLAFFATTLLATSTQLANGDTANGNSFCQPIDVICQHTDELECATADMKDEIKAHFRGAKGYGVMLGLNAQVRAKAAAIHRRVDRDACYSRLVKDAERLDELVCKMQEQYEEILACSTPRRPVRGNTFHVEDKLAAMRELSRCIHAEACHRSGLANPQNLAPAQTWVPIRPVQPVQRQPYIEPVLSPHTAPRGYIEPVLPYEVLPSPRSPRSVLEIPRVNW